MKTFLYGTTAMIAAAAVAGTASAQQAAKKPNEKITLQLGGYFEANYVFGDESRGQKRCPIVAGCTDPLGGLPGTGGLGVAIPPGAGGAATGLVSAPAAVVVPLNGNVNEPGRGRRFQRVAREGEIYFRGQTTLDNGLTIGAFVQLEASTSPDQIDESYIYFSGSFGRVEYGSMDSVAEQMYYGAPAAIQGHSTTVINQRQYQPGGNAITSVNVGPGFTGYADWEKVNYYTPRIAGFQLGISFTPDSCEENNGGTGNTNPSFAGAGSGVTANCGGSAGGFQQTINSGQQGDILTLAANFVRKFGPVDVAVAGFYTKGRLEGPTGTGTVNGGAFGVGATDRKEWGFGTNITWLGFTVGGGWRRDNLGVRSNNTDRTDYAIGVRYRTGPWQFGVEYGRAEQGQGIAGAGAPVTAGTRAGQDKHEVLMAGVDYTMGPGIRFYGGVQYFNLDDNFRNPAAENDGVIVLFGTRLDF